MQHVQAYKNPIGVLMPVCLSGNPNGEYMEFQLKECYDFDDLLALMALLRSESGCPWDRAQTHMSVRSNFLEEAYEAVEALDENDPSHLCEELGDVLLQVVFHARLEEEAGGFAMSDIVNKLCQKLVKRHPHVFGEQNAATPEQALHSWDEIKKRARGQQTQAEAMAGVSRALPAAMRSAKVWKKAIKAEAVPPDAETLLSEVRRGVDKLGQTFSRERTGQANHSLAEQQLGKTMFALCALAAAADIDPERALADACSTYIYAFAAAQKEAGPGCAALAALKAKQPVL